MGNARIELNSPGEGRNSASLCYELAERLKQQDLPNVRVLGDRIRMGKPEDTSRKPDKSTGLGSYCGFATSAELRFDRDQSCIHYKVTVFSAEHYAIMGFMVLLFSLLIAYSWSWIAGLGVCVFFASALIFVHVYSKVLFVRVVRKQLRELGYIGPRTCPSCRYDLTGNQSGVCLAHGHRLAHGPSTWGKSPPSERYVPPVQQFRAAPGASSSA